VTPASQPEEASKLHLGVAGLGLAGSFMIRAARIHPCIKLCAGMDPEPRPREAFSRTFGGRAYENFDSLCGDPDLEAIYIASPHRFHATQAVTALESGKHVLVEKPIALTLDECDAMIEAADRTGRCLIVGHTHAFDPSIREMSRIVADGTLGRLGMILAFNYTDYLYRPHSAEEFQPGKGGGVTFNQVTHQVEIVRLIARSPVRSVRGHVGALDPRRPADGNCMAFLDFESGAAASLVYSAYDFFDSDEFHYWIAEGGSGKKPDNHGAMRHAASIRKREAEDHADLGFGGRMLGDEQPYLPHFGVVIATCERGDLRLSPDGLLLHGVEGTVEIPVPRGRGRPGQGDALDALWEAVRLGQASPHDGRWGRATLEVVLAIRRSALERQEMSLSEQP